MNYIKELNAFYHQITFNPVTGSAVALWNTLMHFNNLCGWKKEFSVAASIIQVKSGIKESSFKRARTELQEKGFINFQSRGRNQAGIYEMISQVPNHEHGHGFVESACEQSDDCIMTNNADHCASGNKMQDERMALEADRGMDESVDHSLNHSMDRSMNHTVAPLIKHKHKQNETKQKEIIITDAIRFYQENFGDLSSFVSDDMLNWIDDVGDSLVIAAMERALEKNKANWGYVKGILQAWAKKGITTVEEAEADEVAFRMQQRQKQFQVQGHGASNEVVPDWFEEWERKQMVDDLKKREPEPVDMEAEKAEFERVIAKFRRD
ncbi:DnaD domain-containing protein [Lentibacillus sp. Marseille-P4043]|uniref:DnaD domain-containing protein n=1 Tax=Lentibacillus sp. Marseille-P4043 TaxID=2040293 RepID=UPI000D0BB423|nr:DnaD domain protein [Lentibacillus sp. Marseille-P4043]